MVGTIDAKGIRDVKSQQTISAYVLTGSEFTAFGQVAVIGLSANGDFTAFPIAVSGGNGTPVTPGRWGIVNAAVASTKAGNFIVAGAAKTTSTAGTTSGNYVIAMSTNGSIIASATVASYSTASLYSVLGMYSSALFDTAGGVIIF